MCVIYPSQESVSRILDDPAAKWDARGRAAEPAAGLKAKLSDAPFSARFPRQGTAPPRAGDAEEPPAPPVHSPQAPTPLTGLHRWEAHQPRTRAGRDGRPLGAWHQGGEGQRRPDNPVPRGARPPLPWLGPPCAGTRTHLINRKVGIFAQDRRPIEHPSDIYETASSLV